MRKSGGQADGEEKEEREERKESAAAAPSRRAKGDRGVCSECTGRGLQLFKSLPMSRTLLLQYTHHHIKQHA